MAGQADGSIVVDTELQTEGFDKGSKDMQRAIDSLQKKVSGLSPTMKKAMRGSASALDSFNGKSQMMEEAIAGIQERMEALGRMRLPTEDYQFLSTEVSKAEKELGKLLDRQAAMENSGVNKSAKAWKNLQYKIGLAKREISEYKAEMEQMEQDGTAFISGKDTSQYAQLESSLTRVTDKLGSMTRKVSWSQSTWAKFGKTLTTLLPKGAAAMLRLSLCANKAHSSFSSGFKTILRYGVGIRSLFMLMSKLRAALVTGYKNLVQYSDQTNTSISSIHSALTQLENSLATAFNPIVTAVAPALVQFINLISEAVSRIGMLTAALSGAKTFTKAKTIQEDYAASLDKSSKAADKTKKALAGFDELNILDDKSTDKNDGSVDPSQMFEQVPIDSSIGDYADQLKKAFEAGDWQGLGTLLGEKINSLIDSIDWEAWGKRIGKGLNGAIQTLYYTIDAVNWVSLGRHLAEAVNGMIGEVDWNKFGRLLSQRFTVALDILGGFFEELDWTKTLRAFTSAFSGFYQQIEDWLKNKDWKSIGETVTAKLSDALQNGNVEEAVKSFFDAFTTALNSIADLLDGIDFYQLAKDLVELLISSLSGVDWAGLTQALGRLIGEAVQGVTGLLAGALSGVADYFKEKTQEAGGNAIAGFFKGIIDAIAGIATWIVENIFKPFWNGICEAFGIHSPSTKMIEIGGYIVAGLIEGIKELPGKLKAKFDEAVKKAEDFASSIIEKVKNGASGAVTKATDAIKNLPGNIKKKLDTTIDNVKNFATSLKDKLKSAVAEAVEKAVDKVKNLPTDFKKKLDDTVSKAKSFATDLKDKLKDGAEKAASNAVKALTNLPGDFKKKFDSAVTNAGKFATSFISKVKGGASSAVTNAVQELSGLPGKVKAKLDSVITNVTSWASTLVSKFTAAGKNALEGIITGINDKIEAVKTAIGGVGTALIEKFKTVLGIHSPSKEFKELAGYIAEGLTTGLDGSKEDVEKAAKQLGEAAVDAAEDAIEGVGATTLQRIKDNLGKIEEAFDDDTGLGKLSNLVKDMFSVDWEEIDTEDVVNIAGDISKLLFDSLDTNVKEAMSDFAVASLGYLNDAYEKNGLQGLASAAKSIVSNLSQNLEKNMGDLVTKGTTIIEQLKNGVLGALGKCNIKLVAIVGVIGLIAAAVVGAWNSSEEFRNAVISALDQIKTTVTNVIDAAKRALSPFINLVKSFLSSVQSLLNQLFSFIGRIFTQIIQWLTPLISMVGQFLESIFGVLEQIGNYITELLEPIIEGVFSVISTILGVLEDIWQNISEALTPAFEAIWDVVSSILQTISDLLSALVDSLKPAVDALSAAFGKIFEAVGKVISAIATALSPIVSVIARVFGTILTIIAQIVGVLVQALAPVIQLIGQVLGAIFSVVGDIISAVVDFLSPIIDVICEAIAGIADILKGIFNVFIMIINGMIGGVEGFINFFISGINAIIKALNMISFEVPDWVPIIGGKKFGFNLSEVKKVEFGRIKEFTDDDSSKTKTSSSGSTPTKSSVTQTIEETKSKQEDFDTEKQNDLLSDILSSLSEITKQSDYSTPTVADGTTMPYSVAATAAENSALMDKMTNELEVSHDRLTQVIVQAIGSATNSICAAVEEYSGVSVNLDADDLSQHTVDYINRKTRMLGTSPLLSAKEV